MYKCGAQKKEHSAARIRQTSTKHTDVLVALQGNTGLCAPSPSSVSAHKLNALDVQHEACACAPPPALRLYVLEALEVQHEACARARAPPPALRLYVLEALEVQDKALGGLLDEHALLRLLQTTAAVTVELVLPVQHLHGAARIRMGGVECAKAYEGP